MGLKEISHGIVNCIYVAQERGQRMAFVDKVKIFLVHYLEHTMHYIYINNEFVFRI
jgi:hypothetical protein